MTRLHDSDNAVVKGDDHDQKSTSTSTPTKQARITRFLPARKARESSKQSTPVVKRTRGGLVSAGEPDLPLAVIKNDGDSTTELSSPEGKSPEIKRTRPALARSPKQKTIDVPASATIQNNETKLVQLSNTLDASEAVKAVPAYQRYAHLVDAAEDDAIDRLQRPHLPLPTKYQLLVRLQQALEGTIAVQAGRGQRPVWHRLIPILQSSLNRTIRQDHFDLLLHFLPNVYCTEPCRIVEKGCRVDSFYVDLAPGLEVFDRQRKDLLTANLLRHVEEEHARFLASINVVVPRNVELRNWHPKFDVEAVSDPISSREGDRRAIDDKAESSKVPDIIKQAINAVQDISTNQPESISISRDSTTKSDEQPKKQLSLKERIRLKEQQADLEKMVGPSSSKSKAIFACLPDLIERIAFLFSSSKKSVLFLSHVHERLKQSWSEAELDERLDALARHLGDWISINRSEAPFTVKVDRNMSVNVLRERIVAASIM